MQTGFPSGGDFQTPNLFKPKASLVLFPDSCL
ncbi:MAG: hypothetical protein QOI53_2370, partial [Verrucomicrobiota bacterium]|nr:hypothetical protein [Verrucomicrobiota bacterium]